MLDFEIYTHQNIDNQFFKKLVKISKEKFSTHLGTKFNIEYFTFFPKKAAINYFKYGRNYKISDFRKYDWNNMI
jgi:hypothetical protein